MNKKTDPMTFVVLLAGAGVILYFLNKKAKESDPAIAPVPSTVPVPTS